MPRYKDWHILFGGSLLVLSLVLYLLHYWIFRDAHHIFIFLLEDIAFIPIHVLLITLIIERIMNEREKKATISKLNMVVSIFFKELGTPLLKNLVRFDLNQEHLAKDLLIDSDWSDQRFFETRKKILSNRPKINSRAGDIAELHRLLAEKREFLLRLLENPSLHEYESFSELIFALFHLNEELLYRENLHDLPDSDWLHVSNDIERTYTRLLFEWLRYVNHLKHHYPYQFSLAVRTNPFNPAASAIVCDSSEDDAMCELRG